MSAALSRAEPPPQARAASASFWLALALVVAVHVLSARWHILYGAQNADEGFYAIATRAVAAGAVPYRDFGFTQPPLVLYANALPLRLVGFGLFPQRTLNGLWAALALALAAGWLARRARPVWALAFVPVFSLCAPWMYFIHLGKTYGLTSLLAMLGAWAFLGPAAGPRRNFTLGVLAALGTATRLPAAPFFAALWLLALWPGRRPTARETCAAAGGVALGAACTMLPFVLADAAAVKFWTLDFHRLSLPTKTWHLSWREIAALAPAAWLLGVAALAMGALRRRRLTRELGVMAAAAAALAANLLPGGVYEEYGVPFLLPLAVAATALLHDELHPRPTAALALAGSLAIAQLVTAPMLFSHQLPERGRTASRWLPPNAPPYNRALPAQLAGARRVVEAALAPGAAFIGTNLILAAETGRAVPPALVMGPFAFTAELPPERAARLHLVTQPQLDEWYYHRPDITLLAFFKRWDLDYGWSMPSFTDVPDDARAQTLAALQRHFDLAYEAGEFLLLVRRPSPLP